MTESRRRSEPFNNFTSTGYSTNSSTPHRRVSGASGSTGESTSPLFYPGVAHELAGAHLQPPLLPVKPEAVELVPNPTAQLSKTQEGSRRLQKILNTGNIEDKAQIINAIMPYVADLIKDQYGNYTVRAIFANCSSFQRTQLLQSIQNELIEIAQHSKGTHPLQYLISQLTLPEEEALLKRQVEPHVLPLACHPSGSRVLLTMLRSLQDTEFISARVLANFDALSRNQHAVCLIKHIMAVMDSSELEMLLRPCILELAQDQYCNYAIQESIQHSFLPESLYPILLENMVSLAAQKFSSNVIERILESRPNQVYPRLLDSDTVTGLINSHFGFYVAKKALKLGDVKFITEFQRTIEGVIHTEAVKKNQTKWTDLLYEA